MPIGVAVSSGVDVGSVIIKEGEGVIVNSSWENGDSGGKYFPKRALNAPPIWRLDKTTIMTKMNARKISISLLDVISWLSPE